MIPKDPTLRGPVLHSCNVFSRCEVLKWLKIWELLWGWNSGSVETIIWLASFLLPTRRASFTRISQIWNSGKCEIKFGGIIYYQEGFSDKAPDFHLSAIYPQTKIKIYPQREIKLSSKRDQIILKERSNYPQSEIKFIPKEGSKLSSKRDQNLSLKRDQNLSPKRDDNKLTEVSPIDLHPSCSQFYFLLSSEVKFVKLDRVWIGIFSCTGSSIIPTLVGDTEYEQRETTRQKFKTKTKTSLLLWRQGSFALFSMFFFFMEQHFQIRKSTKIATTLAV